MNAEGKTMKQNVLDEILANAGSIEGKAEGDDAKELVLLVKDLEEAQFTIFVKTAEAKPFLDRCLETSRSLKQAVEGKGGWSPEAGEAFSSFERAVSKLRNTILVRTQRAT